MPPRASLVPPPRRRTARLLRLLVAALVLVCWAAAAQARTVRAVTEAWPPYVFEEEGTPAGFDYETARAVLAGMGHELVVTFYPWKRCLAMVEDGRADALLDTGRTAARERFLVFPDEPLSESATVLFFRRGESFRFESFEDLRGKVVGTQLGYTYSDEFAAAEGFERVPVSDVRLNIRKLLAGRVDLFMANRGFGLYTAKAMGVLREIDYAERPVSSGAVYLAFSRRSGAAALAGAFSSALAAFRGTAAHRAILGEYGQID